MSKDLEIEFETETEKTLETLTTPQIEEPEAPKRRGRPRIYDPEKPSSERGVPSGMTRGSFIMKKATLARLKEFCTNENLKIQDGLELILSSYLIRYDERKEERTAEKERREKERQEQENKLRGI